MYQFQIFYLKSYHITSIHICTHSHCLIVWDCCILNFTNHIQAQTLAPGYRADIQPPPFAAQVAWEVQGRWIQWFVAWDFCWTCWLLHFIMGVSILLWKPPYIHSFTCVAFQRFTLCECLVLVGQKAWCWSFHPCGIQKWWIPWKFPDVAILIW